MKAGKTEILASLPPVLAHRRTYWGVLQTWKNTVADLCSSKTLAGLPPFAEHMATAMWDTEASHVWKAVRNGDVGFFVGILVRLDLLEQGAKDVGKTIAERSAILRARNVTLGFMDAAARVLTDRGGKWPPHQAV